VLRGDPGLGKTSIIRQTAAKLGLYEETVILAQYDPGDLAGLPYPQDGRAEKLRPGWMPEKDGLLLTVDELGQAFLMNQNLAAQLFEERRLGKHKLPRVHAIVGATNKMSNQAGVQPMPSHLKDRIAIIDIEADIDDFLRFAIGAGIHEHILGHLRFKPEWLSKFDPKHDACPSPRSWMKANRAYGLPISHADRIALISSIVGEAAAADFDATVRVANELPSLEAIWNDPKGHPIPTKAQVKYALASALAMRSSTRTIASTIKFMDRWDEQEFVVFAVRTIQSRPDGKALLVDPAVRDWAMRKGAPLLA